MLPYHEGALTMLQIINFLEDQDFVQFDISNESRPQAHVVQIDMLFKNRNSLLRPSFINFSIL